MDDVRAVLDSVGTESAALFGASEGGPVSAMFATTYPERVSSLVLYGAVAKWSASEDFPWGFSENALEANRHYIKSAWGSGLAGEVLFAPSLAADPQAREFVGRMERLSGTPSTALELIDTYPLIDVRPIVPTVSVPTLVIHRSGDSAIPVQHGRYYADHIPDARFLELHGHDHWWWVGDSEAIAGAIEEFLTGEVHRPEPNRVLKTILFSDIVASTERVVELGDQRWRELLDSHDAEIRRKLEQFRGTEVNTTGDGFLAAFDGPARAIHCAQAIAEEARGLGIAVRVGVHTGECEVRGDDLAGIAVHTGSRVAALAGPGEVLVTSTVRDLVAGSGIEFSDRGLHALKGVPGEWQLLAAKA
jgi:class 3 adenylate cyclase